MRIIESEETTLPEEEVSTSEKPKIKVVSERISPQKEMILIAKEIHELGNKLIQLATKL